MLSTGMLFHLAILFTFALRSTQPDNIAIPFKKLQKINNPLRSVKIKITKNPSIVDRNHLSAHDVSEQIFAHRPGSQRAKDRIFFG